MLLAYVPDWIVTIVLVAAFTYLGNRPGFRRDFSLDMGPTIQYPYALTERVPFWLAGVVAVAAPAGVIVIVSGLFIRSGHDLHVSLLGLLLAVSLALTVTNIVKNMAGRPRPDMLDRCQPVPGSHDAPVFGLSNSSICTAPDDATLQDGFRSFPSGHSSTAFSGLGYLSIYFAAKLCLFNRRGSSIKAWICLVPLMGAAAIAITRTMDNRHHWQDVFIGSLLGFVCARFCWAFYNPSLYSRKPHVPHPPRSLELEEEERDSSGSEEAMLGGRGDEGLPLQGSVRGAPRGIGRGGAGSSLG